MLAWLLGDVASPGVRSVLGDDELIFASDLTLVECERVLIRAVALHEVEEAAGADRRAALNAAAAHWQVLRLSVDVVERARRPLPAEPIRTLDALHLASALAARAVSPGLALLALDDRIRRAGAQLGFLVLPP